MGREHYNGLGREIVGSEEDEGGSDSCWTLYLVE